MISPSTPAEAFRPAPLLETRAQDSANHLAGQASDGPISPFHGKDTLGRESLFPSLPPSAQWLSVAANGNQPSGVRPSALSDIETKLETRLQYLTDQLKAVVAEKASFEKELTQRYAGDRPAALEAFKQYSSADGTLPSVKLRAATDLQKHANALIGQLNQANRDPNRSVASAKEVFRVQGQLHQVLKSSHQAYGELGALARAFNAPVSRSSSNAGICKAMGKYVEQYLGTQPRPDFKAAGYGAKVEQLQEKLQLPLDPIDDGVCEDVMAQIEEITGESILPSLNAAPPMKIPVLVPQMVRYTPESLVSEPGVLATRQPYVYTAPPRAIGTSPTTGVLIRGTEPSNGTLSPGESGFVATETTIGVAVVSLETARRKKLCQVYVTHSLRFIDNGQTLNPEAWTNDRGLTSRGYCSARYGDGTEQRHLLPEEAQRL